MQKLNTDFTAICKKYRAKWVALSEEYKVIAAGRSAKKVFSEAKKKGYTIPTLFKIPTQAISYVGICE